MKKSIWAVYKLHTRDWDRVTSPTSPLETPPSFNNVSFFHIISLIHDFALAHFRCSSVFLETPGKNLIWHTMKRYIHSDIVKLNETPTEKMKLKT